jgi:hypothetical protein
MTEFDNNDRTHEKCSIFYQRTYNKKRGPLPIKTLLKWSNSLEPCELINPHRGHRQLIWTMA